MTFWERLARALSPGVLIGRANPRLVHREPEIASERLELTPVQERFYDAIQRGDRVLWLHSRQFGRGALIRHIERECEKDGVPFRRLGSGYRPKRTGDHASSMLMHPPRKDTP